MKYTVDYFIKKFEAIPGNRFAVNDFINDEGQSCANGHCGLRWQSLLEGRITDEAVGLYELFSTLTVHHIHSGKPIIDLAIFFPEKYSIRAACINNGDCAEYQQPTPKQRILAALYNIKKMQQKDIDTGGKTKTVYVAVPVTITEQAKEQVMS